MSCSLDPTGSGPQVSIPNCVGTVSSSYTFASAGTYRLKLVATHQMNLEASCSDDDTSCTLEPKINSTVVATGTGSLSQALNLTAFDGQQVMLISNGRRYLSKPGQPLVGAGSSLGRTYQTGSAWRVGRGRTVLMTGV